MAVKAHEQLGETNLFFFSMGLGIAGQDLTKNVSLSDLLMQTDMNMLLCDNLLLQMGK